MEAADNLKQIQDHSLGPVAIILDPKGYVQRRVDEIIHPERQIAAIGKVLGIGFGGNSGYLDSKGKPTRTLTSPMLQQRTK